MSLTDSEFVLYVRIAVKLETCTFKVPGSKYYQANDHYKLDLVSPQSVYMYDRIEPSNSPLFLSSVL
jgi:hypothetical protein